MIQLLAGVAIVQDRKVLLLQQDPNYHKDPGLWGPPGGTGETNEDPVSIAIREVKEEAGLDITITGISHVFLVPHTDKPTSIAIIYQATKPDSQEIKVNHGEISQFTWASKSDLEQNKFPLRRDFLKPALIKAVTQSPIPLDTLEFIYKL